MFRRKQRQRWKAKRSALAKRIPNAKIAGIENADDVSGVGFVDRLALLTKKLLRLAQGDALSRAYMLHAHAALEAPRTNAHKRHAIAMRGVHVRLDFEDKATEPFVLGAYDTLVRLT